MTAIQKIFYKLLRPLVEPLIKKIEEGILLKDHLREKNRLYSELNLHLDELLKKKSTDASSIEKIFAYLRNEGEPFDSNHDFNSLKDSKGLLDLDGTFLEIEGLIFNPGDQLYSNREALDQIIDLIKQNNSSIEKPNSYREIYIISSSISFSLQESIELSDLLTDNFHEKKWEALKSLDWCLSFLLLTVLDLHKKNPRSDTKNYLGIAAERLLRKMEIRQDVIMDFVGQPKEKVQLAIEQSRYIYFLLEFSSVFNDIRFLNAALKANDRLYGFTTSIKTRVKNDLRNPSKLLFSFYYLINLNKQESLIKNIK
jgi:hypothetical protein